MIGKDLVSENWNGNVQADFHEAGDLNLLNSTEPHFIVRIALPSVSEVSLLLPEDLVMYVFKGLLILLRKIIASRYITRLKSQLVPEN